MVDCSQRTAVSGAMVTDKSQGNRTQDCSKQMVERQKNIRSLAQMMEQLESPGEEAACDPRSGFTGAEVRLKPHLQS